MKNIFKSLLMVLSCAMFLTSCMEEAAAPLASAIKLDKQEVAFAGSSAQAQKVSVNADGDWFVLVSADWVEVSPMSGSGNGEVIITVSDNLDEYDELNGPRSTVVNFCYGTDGIAPLTVNQNGEAGLDASRTYKKVTSAEEIVAGGYLIVFDIKGKLNALDPLTSATETTYKYASASEVTEKDGVITTPNAASSYIFEAVEGGFHISTAGKYLFQDGNGFLATPDKSKAHVWTVTLDENGLATIKNVTFGNRWMQLDTNYGTAGAYTSARDGALLPYLYIDSKPQTDEVLDAKNVTASPHATEAKIKVTSNKTWKVRNHDEWIKSFTTEGSGNGEVTITFDAYESTTEDRTASFMILGETTNIVVELKQLKVPAKSKVEDITLDAYNGVEGTVVAAGNDGAYVIADETGAVMVYQKNHGRAVGDKVYVEGNALRSSGYNTNPVQITPMYTEEISKNNTWKYAPVELKAAELDALVGEDADCAEVLVKGKLVVSGKYINLVVDGATKQGSIKYMLASGYEDLHGAHVVVKGYTVGTYNYLYILPYSVEIDSEYVVEPQTVTIADFKANESATKYDKFRVTGTIVEVLGESRYVLQAGAETLVVADVANTPSNPELVIGDILTVVGIRSVEDDEVMMTAAVYESHRNAPELSFAEMATVAADATSYSLEILSNIAWTATASEGVTLDKEEGEGNATITLTFPANTLEEEVEHTVTLSSELGMQMFILVQEAAASGIATIKETATSTTDAAFTVNVKNAVVTYVSGSNAYIQDSEAGILIYKSGHGLLAGDVLNGEISGKVKLYNNLREVTAIDYSKAVKTKTTEIPETVLTIAELKASGAYDKYENMRIRIKNAEMTKDDELSQNGQTYTIYKKNSSATGFKQYNYVDVVGYPGKYNENVQLNVFENATVLGASKTVISVGDVEVEIGATKANKATASSGAAVKYVSANDGIAKVDQNGNVTGVAEGETTVTVSVDAYNNYPAAEATFKVKVVPAGTVVETASATLTFDNKSKRTTYNTTQQVWTENGITMTNDKSSSTNNVGDYVKPARLYANSKVTVTAPGKITKIVFDCSSTSYASALKSSIGATATALNDKVTVTLSNPQDSFVVTKLTAQVRLDAMTVTYQE